jgi:hypothetical protein
VLKKNFFLLVSGFRSCTVAKRDLVLLEITSPSLTFEQRPWLGTGYAVDPGCSNKRGSLQQHACQSKAKKCPSLHQSFISQIVKIIIQKPIKDISSTAKKFTKKVGNMGPKYIQPYSHLATTFNI